MDCPGGELPCLKLQRTARLRVAHNGWTNPVPSVEGGERSFDAHYASTIRAKVARLRLDGEWTSGGETTKSSDFHFTPRPGASRFPEKRWTGRCKA
jgi:hypothetical protein